MIFSSTVFLFQFLPICLLVYFGVLWSTRKVQYANIALIFISLAFYFIGNGYLVLLIIGSIVMNFALGKAIAKTAETRQRTYLTMGIVANLALLMFFKYAGFIANNFTGAANLLGWHLPNAALSIALPVGIS